MSEPWPMDQLIGHTEETDGIEEYDNPMPGWFRWIFYITIGIGVFIFVDWHVVHPKSQEGLYEEERRAAIARYGELTPLFAEYSEERALRGEALYGPYCAACHAPDGSGLSGPSFIDGLWVHGGSMDDITRVVFFGLDGKGMPAWGAMLGAEAVADLSAYVRHLAMAAEDAP